MITLLLHNTTHNNNSNNKKTCTPSEDMPLQVALFVSTTLQYGTSLVSLQDKHFQELPRFGNHGSSLCIALFSSNNCFKQKTKKKRLGIKLIVLPQAEVKQKLTYIHVLLLASASSSNVEFCVYISYLHVLAFSCYFYTSCL